MGGNFFDVKIVNAVTCNEDVAVKIVTTGTCEGKGNIPTGIGEVAQSPQRNDTEKHLCGCNVVRKKFINVQIRANT